MVMMDELIQAVGRAAKLPPEQASVAVDGMLRFLAARLPSPIFGELQARLGVSNSADSRPPPKPGA
ncbi:MAG: hypothetical protein CFE40_02570 [Burkholderiales bacterium PBB1]|nr:MAG: hypothetical protein CFE40_02570 [Burkholderiales bacterium PBB1]